MQSAPYGALELFDVGVGCVGDDAWEALRAAVVDSIACSCTSPVKAVAE